MATFSTRPFADGKSIVTTSNDRRLGLGRFDRRTAFSTLESQGQRRVWRFEPDGKSVKTTDANA